MNLKELGERLANIRVAHEKLGEQINELDDIVGSIIEYVEIGTDPRDFEPDELITELEPRNLTKSAGACKVYGCKNSAVAAGLCNEHLF